MLVMALNVVKPYHSVRRLHKFAAEVAGELDWLSERAGLASSEVAPSDLHAAQSATKKHAKLRAELSGRRPIVERLLKQGEALQEGHPQKEKVSISNRSHNLKRMPSSKFLD